MRKLYIFNLLQSILDKIMLLKNNPVIHEQIHSRSYSPIKTGTSRKLLAG